MNTSQNSEVKLVRLNTGEDIVGNCLFDDESNSLLIDSPMKVMISRVTNVGKTMLIMMPWLPLEIVEENLITINYNDIITTVNPKKEFIEYYFDTVDKYVASLEMDKLEESMFGDDLEENDEMDVDTMEEMLDIIKDRKNKSIH